MTFPEVGTVPPANVCPDLATEPLTGDSLVATLVKNVRAVEHVGNYVFISEGQLDKGIR